MLEWGHYPEKNPKIRGPRIPKAWLGFDSGLVASLWRRSCSCSAHTRLIYIKHGRRNASYSFISLASVCWRVARQHAVDYCARDSEVVAVLNNVQQPVEHAVATPYARVEI
jgi:hypothetical protein